MSSTLWSPTREFPHPLAYVDLNYGVDQSTSNLHSYALAEESIWDTIIEPINRFRQQFLGLQSITPAVGGQLL
ncbi:hypothetical protein BDV29DRAFT_152589 [Aspergillus leporis]|uniref:Uncharacterized protein n=1 Tax=Aspergillus leporis TaxID=41062 RepID=A0A5N5XH02_9EURO|nr:hypothetical protein BDV29DRAFT_152589 [Aspergillus leporis]